MRLPRAPHRATIVGRDGAHRLSRAANGSAALVPVILALMVFKP